MDPSRARTELAAFQAKIAELDKELYSLVAESLRLHSTRRLRQVRKMRAELAEHRKLAATMAETLRQAVAAYELVEANRG